MVGPASSWSDWVFYFVNCIVYRIITINNDIITSISIMRVLSLIFRFTWKKKNFIIKVYSLFNYNDYLDLSVIYRKFIFPSLELIMTLHSQLSTVWKTIVLRSITVIVSRSESSIKGQMINSSSILFACTQCIHCSLVILYETEKRKMLK